MIRALAMFAAAQVVDSGVSQMHQFPPNRWFLRGLNGL